MPIVMLIGRVGTLAAKYPDIKTQIHSIDFSSASADYAALGKELDQLDVGVLSECLSLLQRFCGQLNTIRVIFRS